ncbi:DUF4395 domain-containing protein [Microbacterium koreense]|uniref:DUF4395 domain-containing protein n=1 Tax=Microbacterium koreense TaxID=323761 RepID=A0ABW2ZTA7_9MICO
MSEDEPTRPAGIDPRGPRFAAAITSALLLVVVFVGLTTPAVSTASFGWLAYQPLSGQTFVPGLGSTVLVARATQPAFLLLVVLALLFLWGVLSPRTMPWAVIYRRLVQPRLAPPAEWEDPRPPRFAQGVGLAVVTIGIVLHLIGLPLAVPVSASIAFVAAFLNAAFGVCLGCMMYLGLARAGLLGRARPSAS